jgi:hypothetical protein
MAGTGSDVGVRCLGSGNSALRFTCVLFLGSLPTGQLGLDIQRLSVCAVSSQRRGFRFSPCIAFSLAQSSPSLFPVKKVALRSIARCIQFLSYRLFIPWVPPYLFSPHFCCRCFGYVSYTTSTRSTNHPTCCSSSLSYCDRSQGKSLLLRLLG